MKVTKWGNSLGVRIPKDVARELGICEGDEIALTRSGPKAVQISKMSREEAIASLRRYRGMLPRGFRFDREAANAR